MRIREARVPIVNDNECVRKINTVTEKIFILPASSFCAGGIKGHDACQVSPLAASQSVPSPVDIVQTIITRTHPRATVAAPWSVRTQATMS